MLLLFSLSLILCVTSSVAKVNIHCGCTRKSCNRCTDLDLRNLNRWKRMTERQNRFNFTSRSGRLCYEPIMLPPHNSNWTMACIWSWDGQIRCGAAPPGIFGYVSLKEWREYLSEFRRSMGCPKGTIDDVPEGMDEVYYCRERCSMLGMGTLTMILIVLTLMASLCYISATVERQRQ